MMSIPLLWSNLEHVTPGSHYFCLSRHRPYSYECILEAQRRGAVATYSLWDFDEPNHTTWPASRDEQIKLIDSHYHHHECSLKIIAITGTNGKSSTACLMQVALEKAGYGTTLIGTIGIRFSSQSRALSNNLTTPDYADLKAYIMLAERKGHSFVVMEASSHALSQYRLGTLKIHLAAATAITCDDHLEYHGSAYEYIKAKGLLFEHYQPVFAVLPSPHHLWPYVSQRSQVRSYIPQNVSTHTPLQIQWQWPNIELSQHMLQALQISVPHDRLDWVKSAAVTGRFEPTSWMNDRIAWVDFAHTPHAMLHLFSPWRAGLSQPLWVVIGCGGRRDRAKRPMMLSIARQYADIVIITADNPRDEPFSQIVADMLQNETYDNVRVIENRSQAIAYAASYAPARAHIFILGKGHEQTQIIGSQSFDYSDRKEVQRYVSVSVLPS